MPIETLDDIISELLDKCYIYGAHDEECEQEEATCRSCCASEYRDRILEAIKVEEWIKQQRLGNLNES